jgi:hypothetical protein
MRDTDSFQKQGSRRGKTASDRLANYFGGLALLTRGIGEMHFVCRFDGRAMNSIETTQLPQKIAIGLKVLIQNTVNGL